MHCSRFIMTMNITRILYHMIQDNTKHNEQISHEKRCFRMIVLHLWTYCSHSCAFVTGYVVRPAVFPASLKGKGPVPPGAGPRFISAGNPWPLSRIR